MELLENLLEKDDDECGNLIFEVLLVLLILNNLLPIFTLMTLGIFLKYSGWINDLFIEQTDRMIYYVFFPALLFWKISKPSEGFNIETELIIAVCVVVFTVFLTSVSICRLLGMPDHEIGSFSQACYRFNSYIGLALTFSAVGEEAGRTFGVMIGFIIPFINVLAVSSMIFYSGDVSSGRSKIRMVVRAMASNPLILACLAGILFSRMSIGLPVFVDNTLALSSSLTLPLALVCIGGTLKISGYRKYLGKAVFAGLIKLALMPLAGLFLLNFMDVSDTSFKTAMIYFALPTSAQNYILSSQLNSDVQLATLTILASTVLSILSLSVVLIFFV